MKINIYKTKDHVAIAKLNESVQSLHHSLYPEEFKKFDGESVAGFFETSLNQDDVYAYIAEVDTVHIGYILCIAKTRKENVFQYEKCILHIDQIGVNHGYREQGVGRLLVHAALELAKELKVSEVQLDHWVKNDEVRGFFRSLGFDYYNHRMKKQ